MMENDVRACGEKIDISFFNSLLRTDAMSKFFSWKA